MRIIELGLADYKKIWIKMVEFTATRTKDTLDELWITEHNPIYTLGKNADKNNIIDAGDIPILRVDRGGEVTYHGPGQIIIYVLIDLKRKALNISDLIFILEESIILLLKKYNIRASRMKKAPGVYVDNMKIASIGIRVSRGCTYHGLSFNYDVDLEPFFGINTCGFNQLNVTSLKKLNMNKSKVILIKEISGILTDKLIN
jgi:lipoyl(octanoyl) transferase